MDNYIRISVPTINVAFVKNLLKETPNFDISSIFIYNTDSYELKTTLANYAVQRNDEELLDYLINEKVDLNIEIRHHGTPLCIAIIDGNFEFVKKLVESGADVNLRLAKTFETPLVTATEVGDFEIAKYLIDNGADVNAVTTIRPDLGHTPILIAANYSPDHIELLLEHNAEPFGTLPSFDLSVADVKNILTTSPNLNINSFFVVNFFDDTDDEYSALTLVQLAVHYKKEEILDYLIESNADINLCIPGIGTALHIATKINNLEFVKKLIASGAKVNVKTAEWSLSPLIYAARRSFVEVAEYLIDHGVEINSTAKNDLVFDGLNALHVAAYKKSTNFVELLLKNNADINIKSDKGWTPIMFACEDENLEMIKMLIARGAVYENRVLRAVMRNKNTQVLEYLLTLDVDEINNHYTDAKLTGTTSEEPVLHYIIKRQDRWFPNGDINWDIIEIIIDAGFNINSVNYYNEIIVGIAKMPRILNYIKRQIVKLKQAGFYLCQRNIEAVEDEYNDFQIECDHEVKKLTTTKIITSNLVLYKVLHKTVHSLAIRLKHSNIDDIAHKNKLVKIYPIYGRIIYYKLAKVQRRIELLKNVEEFLDYILNYSLKLPYTFTRELYMCLTNEDLKKLVQ